MYNVIDCVQCKCNQCRCCRHLPLHSEGTQLIKIHFILIDTSLHSRTNNIWQPCKIKQPVSDTVENQTSQSTHTHTLSFCV